MREATSISFSAEEMGLGYLRTEPGWPVFVCVWWGVRGGQDKPGKATVPFVDPKPGLGCRPHLDGPVSTGGGR